MIGEHHFEGEGETRLLPPEKRVTATWVCVVCCHGVLLGPAGVPQAVRGQCLGGDGEQEGEMMSPLLCSPVPAALHICGACHILNRPDAERC